MRTLLLLTTMLAATLTDWAQNLITNGSFEQHSQCPDNYGEVEYCTGWHKSWNNNDPTYHTEYLHACGTSMFSEPSNTWGFQQAATGQGYMAEVTMAPTVMTDYRENIYTQFATPLQIGHKYQASVMISFTDNSQQASNNYGMKFSTVSSFPINGVCQLHSAAIVTDATNWTTISGSFIADSAYSFVCVGNFIPDANTVTTTACPTCPYSLFGYYVDDVSVVDSGAVTQPTHPINTTAPLNPVALVVDSGAVAQPTQPIDTTVVPDPVVPNVITPNGDGLNDLIALNSPSSSPLQLVIFNRWGQALFRSSGTHITWTGRTNAGARVSDGVYYYELTGLHHDGSTLNMTGYVQVLSNGN